MPKKIFYFSLCCVIIIAWWTWMPSRLFMRPYSTVLLDSGGELLSATTAADGQWRFPDGDSVPYKFRKCILAFEDEYFHYHPGVNPISLGRAFLSNFSRTSLRGGSTITMQLARLIYNNRPRTYSQKAKEILFALRIECSLSKSAILQKYCAHAPFGGNVVGLAAASWRHFGRSPYDLSWSEAATLAVLPNAPGLIYPGKNQERLLSKRNFLLRKLMKTGVLDSATYELALMEALPTAPQPIRQSAPHLLARCAHEKSRGLIFKSTLVKETQEKVTAALDEHVNSMKPNRIHNACAIVAEVNSGKIIAYVGNSTDPAAAHHNWVDIARSPRSTGSILKPFLYAFMLNDGFILPHSLIDDVPIHMGAYSPKNYHLSFDGLVPASFALTRSLNVPAVKMLADYGVGTFYTRLKQVGISTFNKPPSHYGLSLILGGGESTLFDLASAYASMARTVNYYRQSGGRYNTSDFRPLHYYRNQQSNPSRIVSSALLSASSIYFTFSAMNELARPEDFVSNSEFLSRRKIAWKTGTSFGFRDAWAIGIDDRYVVAVWVGNASGEGRPELTGTAAAAPLMFSIFNLLPRGNWFKKPLSEMELVTVCNRSGYRASENCEHSVSFSGQKGAGKAPLCKFHRVVQLDVTEQYQVASDCFPVAQMKMKKWFVAGPIQEFYFKKRAAWYRVLPPMVAGCAGTEERVLEIAYPVNGFDIYVPVIETGMRSEFVMKATHRDSNAELFWHLDGEFIGTTKNIHQLAVTPPPGKHHLIITDVNGAYAECGFRIIGNNRTGGHDRTLVGSN